MTSSRVPRPVDTSVVPRLGDTAPLVLPSATRAWEAVLRSILDHGRDVAPREKPTLEVAGAAVAFEMLHPVVSVPARKLSYSFLAGEALWILSGSDLVDEIAPWNARIAEFSDDGVRFAGAYGPRFVAQLDWVVAQLARDPETRQAVMEIWRPMPSPSKDVPCTLSLTFSIRGADLNCHASMRSSDAWLGFPYDVFNFTMLAARVRHAVAAFYGQNLGLGTLYWTAASSHLYRENWDAARAIVAAYPEGAADGPSFPWWQDWPLLLTSLEACRDRKNEDNVTWRIRPRKAMTDCPTHGTAWTATPEPAEAKLAEVTKDRDEWERRYDAAWERLSSVVGEHPSLEDAVTATLAREAGLRSALETFVTAPVAVVGRRGMEYKTESGMVIGLARWILDEDLQRARAALSASPEGVAEAIAKWPHLYGISDGRTRVIELPEEPWHSPDDCARLGGRCAWDRAMKGKV